MQIIEILGSLFQRWKSFRILEATESWLSHYVVSLAMAWRVLRFLWLWLACCFYGMSFCRFSHLSGAVIDSSNAFVAQNVITKCIIVVRINPTNNTTLLVIGRFGEGECKPDAKNKAMQSTSRHISRPDQRQNSMQTCPPKHFPPLSFLNPQGPLSFLNPLSRSGLQTRIPKVLGCIRIPAAGSISPGPDPGTPGFPRTRISRRPIIQAAIPLRLSE